MEFTRHNKNNNETAILSDRWWRWRLLKLAVNFVVLADGSMTGSGGVTVGRLESSYDLHVRACVADSK